MTRKIIIIDIPGSKVRYSKGAIEYFARGQILREPVKNIDTVILYPGTMISTNAINALTRRGVIVIFANKRGFPIAITYKRKVGSKPKSKNRTIKGIRRSKGRIIYKNILQPRNNKQSKNANETRKEETQEKKRNP